MAEQFDLIPGMLIYAIPIDVWRDDKTLRIYDFCSKTRTSVVNKLLVISRRVIDNELQTAFRAKLNARGVSTSSASSLFNAATIISTLDLIDTNLKHVSIWSYTNNNYHTIKAYAGSHMSIAEYYSLRMISNGNS